MIPITTSADSNVAVFGLGGSGRAACAALAAGGATVAAWDDSEKGRASAAEAGLPLVDLAAADWSAFSALVLAPGVPLTHPEPHWAVKKARAAGVPVIGDVELFARERAESAPDAPFIAITGTNGKSTTTALVAHVLKSAGLDVQMGGNIGVPILQLEPPADGRIHVIELSSYQIDLMPSLAPSIGVLLNVSPDHIDRHGTFANYAKIKERVVSSARFSLVGIDDETTAAVARKYAGTAQPRCVAVSTSTAPDAGIFCEGTAIFLRETAGGPPRLLADIAGIPTLRGTHNVQNAAFSAAIAHRLGLDEPALMAGLRSFPGLAHRMEIVGRQGRVLFVNDSKATNAASAEKALSSFANGIYWVAGGLQKEGGIAPLRHLFPRVEKAYLIGECAEDFARTLDGYVPYEKCGTLAAAVAAASRDAGDGTADEPVVLLSPACASFDQFRSFEVRGDAFREIVAGLPDVELRERGTS